MPDKPYVYEVSIGQKVIEDVRETTPMNDVKLSADLKPVMGPDGSFYQWMREARAGAADPPLCVGCRIEVDEHGEGTLAIDDELPRGVWLVTQGGVTKRLTGVTGPIRAQTHAETTEDIEVSPVALTFETRDVDAQDPEVRERDDEDTGPTSAE